MQKVRQGIITALVAVVTVAAGIVGMWMVFEELPVLGAFPGQMLSVQQQSVVDLVPDDAEGVVVVDVLKTDGELLQRFVEELPTLGMVRGLFETFLQDDGEAPIGLERDILPWIGRELGVWVSLHDDEPIPDVVFLAQSRNFPRTRRFVERLIAYSGQTANPVTVAGYDVQEIVLEESMTSLLEDPLVSGDMLFAEEEAADEEKLPIRLHIGLVENVLVVTFGTREDTYEQIVTLAQGKGESLSRTEIFAREEDGVAFRYQTPEKEEVNDAAVNSVLGSISTNDDVLAITYRIQGNSSLLRERNLVLTGNGNSPSTDLLQVIPSATYAGVYLVPSVKALLPGSQQPLPLPLSRGKEEFSRQLQQYLQLAPEQVTELFAGDTLIVLDEQGFGLMTNVADLEVVAETKEAFATALHAIGIDFTHMLKPHHRGVEDVFATYNVVEKTMGERIFNTLDQEYALSLTRFADQETTQPIFVGQEEASIPDATLIPFQPVWGMLNDETFVWFSTIASLEKLIGEDSQGSMLATDVVLDSLLAPTSSGESSFPLIAVLHVEQDMLENAWLGDVFPGSFSWQESSDVGMFLVEEILRSSQRATSVLRGDSATVEVMTVLEPKGE